MRSLPLLLALTACTSAPAPHEPSTQRRGAASEHSWTDVRTIPLATADSAHFGLDHNVYAVNPSGLWRIGPGGTPVRVSDGNQAAAVAVDPTTGGVFMSEDFDGGLWRFTPPAGRELWVSGLHSGDDDPAGMSFAPLDYDGPLLEPGEGVVVDRGYNGPNQVWAFSTTIGHSDDPANERLVVPNQTPLSEPFDIAVDRTRIVIADGDSGLLTVEEDVDGNPVVSAVMTEPALVTPVAVDIDPLTGLVYVVDESDDTLYAVDMDAGTATGILALPAPLAAGRWAGVDLSEDGLRLVITTNDALYEYARCDADLFPEAPDCDDDGIIDVCAVATLDLPDCNSNYAPDTCEVADGAADCDGDGIPDICPTCPPLEVVFLMDTSTSMDGEGGSLCAAIDATVADLGAQGIDVSHQAWGLTAAPSGYPCLTSTLPAELGTTLPGPVPEGLTDFADCPGGSEVGSEDWARGVGVVAGRYWTEGEGDPTRQRIIVPVFDEGPWCGDPVTAIDNTAVDYAIDVSLAHNVAVFPITGSGSSAAVSSEAQRLAMGTGGVVTASSGSTQIGTVLGGLLSQACRQTEDCDLDGIKDTCEPAAPGEVDCDCDGLFDGCDVNGALLCEDTDADGIGDPCDTCVDLDGDGFGESGTDLGQCDGGDTVDNCPNAHNPDQADTDGDGIGDACDDCNDRDGDLVPDAPDTLMCDATQLPIGPDNCPDTRNVNQQDADDDGLGDACDPCNDVDGDGFGDSGLDLAQCTGGSTVDNCPDTPNADQTDTDGDGIGDACDDCNDRDGDLVPDAPDTLMCDDTQLPIGPDNCPDTPNADQQDADADGIGDACDDTPDPDTDVDTDPDTEPDTDVGTDPDTEPDTDVGTDPDTDTEPDTDVDTEPDSTDGCSCTTTPHPASSLLPLALLGLVLRRRSRRG